MNTRAAQTAFSSPPRCWVHIANSRLEAQTDPFSITATLQPVARPRAGPSIHLAVLSNQDLRCGGRSACEWFLSGGLGALAAAEPQKQWGFFEELHRHAAACWARSVRESGSGLGCRQTGRGSIRLGVGAYRAREKAKIRECRQRKIAMLRKLFA